MFKYILADLKRLHFILFEYILKPFIKSRPKQPVEERALRVQAQTAEETADPRVFMPSDYGNGAFGQWIIDENELPAYFYTMDQYTNPAARYPTSEGKYSVVHWHQMGNNRLNAIATNDGVVQVYVADRGGAFLNNYDAGEVKGCLGIILEFIATILYAPIRWIQTMLLPEFMRPYWEPGLFKRLRAVLSWRNIGGYLASEHAYVGGYGYVYAAKKTWATAYRYRPSDMAIQPHRIFGIGYFKTVSEYQGIRVTRWVYAPPDDLPIMVADVILENTGNEAVDVSYYEYWDVNINQLAVQLARTGVAGRIGNADRRELNLRFSSTMLWDGEAKALRFHQKPPLTAPPPNRVDQVNWYQADVFLADLNPDEPHSVYTDKMKFFGKGGATQPDAIVKRSDGNIGSDPDAVMRYCMVIRREVRLEPGETKPLRFAYGTVQPGESFDFLDAFRQGSPYQKMITHWKQRLAYFSGGNEPALQRETAWNTYYLLSSMVRNDFYGVHVAPQGSAYLYLHGSDGAPRDQALFTIPLTYLDPQLARDQLELTMQLTDAATGQIAYAFAGYGIAGGAGIHNKPSDLDLFFLLALWEYISATGDMAFLEKDVRFYPDPNTPQPPDISVLQHTLVAFKHLIADVGLGEENLIRISDGDWSDGIVLNNVLKFPPIVSYIRTLKWGESIPNTQMALYVLPRIANLIALDPSEKAQQIAKWMLEQLDILIPKITEGIANQWTGQWYTRAILISWWRNQRVPIYKDDINLESQVWALICGLDTQNTLVNSIYTLLDKDSPIGAPTMQRDEIWPAISQLLTWGYTRTRPDLAWRSLINNMFAARANTFPDIWFDVWSGPDGVKAANAAKDPGGTWASPVTPMTDFPTMNNNQHAMALLALLRVCGIEPLESGLGLQIKPQIPDRYALDFSLLKLNVAPGKIEGVYQPQINGDRILSVYVSDNPQNLQVKVNEKPYTPTIENGFALLKLQLLQGQAVPFSLMWE